MKKSRLIAIYCLCAASLLHSQGDGKLRTLLNGMNDHLKARQNLQPAVITAPPAKSLAFEAREVQASGGKSHVFVVKAANEFDVVFSSNPQGSPVAKGDFTIKRGIKPNAVKNVKISLAEGGSLYVLLEPFTNDRTYLKLVSGDTVLSSRVVLAAPIYSLYARSVEYILGLAGSKVDWEAALAFHAVGTEGSYPPATGGE